ncbi:exonuclease/endonuclease/phosphatase family protein [Methanolobus halotolerans]|uniref:Endonuclease/exonuclease/phosphatase domain-containing protein n=1 Tax=Methanolobus halotolerans TaxID=2052935 RepID=A0A4E0QRV5_9EURY|nr:endonuclease/exonuclease/phosphatase family protein [Methanolobus halotolerans]TGC09441.1 hypothetical protein CUN85_06325 [Methanolobus halotolerans]
MKTKTLTFIILFTFILGLGCVSEDNVQTIDEVVKLAESIADDNQIAEKNQPTHDNQKPDLPFGENTSDDTIRIGAFNIQVFGVSKADKPEVMNILADIVRTYDVVAIQEIRDKSQTALPELIDLVNSDGSEYDYVVSERLGRTISKEQYAYVYNTQNVAVNDAYTYPEPDGTDPFHRQPYIVSIEALQGNYDATLIVIHTDPDEATQEINGLDDVLSYAQSKNPEEGDFIIMGDLNADGSYFDEDGTSDLDAYQWVIDDTVDTTTKSTDYTYDRIILTDESDLAGESGVFRYDLEYGLDEELTTDVSDHYPVFVEFTTIRDLD